MRYVITTVAFFTGLVACAVALCLHIQWLAWTGIGISAAAWWARTGD